MLSYRHQFHAGNFADVFKHALLSRLLIALTAKEKPFVYLDTHAGIGRYDLKHPWAQKAREFENGIARIWEAKDAPSTLSSYLAAVRALNTDRKLRYYPGSPLIARHHLRDVDRMVLVELNKPDHLELQAVFARERRVAMPLMDGFQALKAYLPPAERRGLVLVDPSFDRAREFQRIVKAIKEAHERWATGIYAIWYPLMEPAAMRDFSESVARSGIRKILQLEIEVRERGASELIPGCGMLVIKPPWGFYEEGKSIVQWLAPTLAFNGPGRSSCHWLVPE